MILYLACLPGALLSLPNLGKGNPEMNPLLFFRIDAWGPSWVQGKLFPGIRPLTSAGACCSSHCQTQSLLHVNQICERSDDAAAQLVQGTPLLLTRLQQGNTALAAWRRICCWPCSCYSIWDVQSFVQIWRDGSCLHVCIVVLHSGEHWHLLLEALITSLYSCLCFCVGNAPQLLGRQSDVLSRTVDHLSHWGVFIYAQNNFPHIKIKVQVF